MEVEKCINNIFNEDSYTFIKQIPDKSIDLVIIDPPYKFDSDGVGGGTFGSKNRKYHNETLLNPTKERQKYLDYLAKNGKDDESERLRIIANTIDNKNSTKALAYGFNNTILDELCRVMKQINIYVWCNKNQLSQIINYFEDKNCNLDFLTWHKTNPVPTCNNKYLSDTEYCVYAREQGVKVYGSYETKRKYYVTATNTDDKSMYNHPTIKPLNIIKNLVINSSNEGDIVLDCFSGSGTTCLAAKQLKRKYIGIEIDPKYYEVSINRLKGINANGQLTIDSILEG